VVPFLSRSQVWEALTKVTSVFEAEPNGDDDEQPVNAKATAAAPAIVQHFAMSIIGQPLVAMGQFCRRTWHGIMEAGY
jgi:hypothetical protein